GSIADRAGIEPGQEILAVDGEPTPTLQTLGEQLVLRLGEEGTINFRVKYQDSNLSYDLEAELNGWQVDTDNPDPIGDIGIELYTPKGRPVADQVMDAEPAAEAGLRSGDRITAMDGIEVSDWAQWVEYVRARPGETIAIEVARGSEKFATQITP